MVNGGIIGALLDCHSNWTAAYALMRQANETHPPCTVTAYFNVSLKRPTPSDQNLSLKAKIKSIYSDRAEIIAELWAKVAGAEKLCASCEGLFVAVKEGHPAYHRW
jgi:acyl-coenzyme A thioesterase PaaI-like protein